MAHKSLIKYRSSAFDRQGGRCYYCGCQMWRDSLKVFAQLNGISLRCARHCQCTAEHLVAKQDGGADTRTNIVAACLLCNRRRHQRKKAPAPDQYKALVQQRLSKGRWHSPPLSSWATAGRTAGQNPSGKTAAGRLTMAAKVSGLSSCKVFYDVDI